MDPEIPIEQFEVFATGLDHPECVAFDREGYCWAGGEAGQVYRIDPGGKVETVANLGTFNGGLAWSPNDDALYVCNPAAGVVRVTRDGRQSLFADRAGNRKLVGVNYALFDRSGNLYVTDSGNWQKRNGSLIRFRPDGTGEVLAGPFGYVNGLALSEDERTLFMVESDTDRVLRFDLHPNGSIEGPTPYATVERLPDGLALDAAGNLYVACYASDDIHRVAPDGTVTRLAWDRWGITLGRPTNLAFGGTAFDTLYVANLGRQTITRVKLPGVSGLPPVNLRL